MNRSPMTPAEIAELAADVVAMEAALAEAGNGLTALCQVAKVAEDLARLLATIEHVRADGASSHSRFLVADADLRYHSEKAAKHWRERDAALATLDSIADALDVQGVPTTLPPEEGDDTITLTTPRRVLWLAGQWDQQKTTIRQVIAERDELALCLLAERGAGGAPDGWTFEEGRPGVQPLYRRGTLEVRRRCSGTGWELRRWDNTIASWRYIEDSAIIDMPARELMLGGNDFASAYPELMTVQPRPHNGSVDGGRWG